MAHSPGRLYVDPAARHAAAALGTGTYPYQWNGYCSLSGVLSVSEHARMSRSTSLNSDSSSVPSEPGDYDQLPPQVFRQAVEQSALAISITDAHAHIVYANPAFQRVTGYTLPEVIGRNESILSYRVTPPIVYESMWAQLLRQKPWNGLLVNRRKDGSRYLADLTITPVLDEEQNITHYLGMHRDVTEMHRLERQVRNQKTLIESVVDAAQVAMVLLDSRERVLLSNQTYKKLIGDLAPDPAQLLLSALEREVPAFDRVNALASGFAPLEVRIDRQDREPLWFSCAGSLIDEQDTSAEAFYENRGYRYMLLVVQDISELKRQQDHIRASGLRALLTEQERVRSVRETLSGAIYQLGGPLNMIAAAAKLLERQPQLDQQALKKMFDDVLRVGGMTLDNLNASIPALAQEPLQPVNLNAILQNVLWILTPRLLGLGIVVEWRPESLVPHVNGLPTSLTMLFKQLLDNAIEGIDARRQGTREISVTTLAREDHVEVLIEDSGAGIAAELQSRVFEPFFTTKTRGQPHIGMGLTMAQDVVMRHEGLIEIDSVTGQGCQVRVQIPYV